MVARNAMEIFTALNKTNCRECGEKTCLAFAGAVFTGRKSIQGCPYLSSAEKQRLGSVDDGQAKPAEDETDKELGLLISQLKNIDFAEAAARSGGRVSQGKLCIKVMGKEFRVDRDGNFSSDIHINNWVVVPYLLYVLYGKGLTPKEEWISYREVKGGRERYGLFQKRCEEDLRKIADAWPELFHDMVGIFQGREVESRFAADVSVVLLPLPRVPVMICYWRPDEGLDSTLNIYFDATVDQNIGNDGIYSLCAGLVGMFTKLAERHGFKLLN
ncbi:DUF3786 domain-containing protein [Desulfopila aestuarii]|uniref:Putative Fe-S cluster n=1 Tax=Desulfopila aestuarii DSM 18488 TaxID=1121416 RepID=A0A1M7Y3D3_9BACT|nr:DUF3786 domain-containing protein [Desulfopila aestuarii]SHO46616.1 Putative Fe-S cluster [Desulfopila aestuarii DSM 18488]